MQDGALPMLLPPQREMEAAFAAKDAGYDGVFYVAVRTTGVFCRPSCRSRPQPKNLEYFASVRECQAAGYRACKRCDPLSANGAPPVWIHDVMQRVRDSESGRLSREELNSIGVSPERLRRWFTQHLGMTFAEWCRGQRVAGAFDRLREGMSLDEAGFESGYESASGFREAFTRVFGNAPGQARRRGDRMVIQLLETPFGPVLAGAQDHGIGLLEFTGHDLLAQSLGSIRKRIGTPIVPGDHPWLTQLKVELAEYFAGERKEFGLSLIPGGTAFQQGVWSALRDIPYGETIAYDELARRMGRPGAQRAVANANGQNPIAILIPCHRVVGKDGTLTGYGGGALAQATASGVGTQRSPAGALVNTIGDAPALLGRL